MLALGAIEAYGLYRAYKGLEAGTASLQSSINVLGRTPATWTPERIDSASIRERQARAAIEPARDRIEGDPLLRLALLQPYVSDQARAVIDLAVAAGQVDAADRDAIQVARDYQSTVIGRGTAPGPAVIAFLGQAAPPLADADTRLRGATAALDRDSRSRILVPQLRSRMTAGLRLLRPAASAAHDASLAASLVPGAIGGSGPRDYLLLLPNPSEIRPDGGFSGVVGRITIDNGSVTGFVLLHSDAYSSLYKSAFPPEGQEGNYLSFVNGQVGIGDAGWNPDFPTSAKRMEAMYLSATGVQVAGTISVDPYLLSSLLAVTGPVDVSRYGTFDSGNFFPRLNAIVNATPAIDGGGTQAVTPIARAVLDKLVSQPASKWTPMATAIQNGVQQGHARAVSDNTRIAALLHELHADGSLVATPLTEDYLLISEANVAGNKADYYLKRSVSVKVEIYPSGINRHEIDIHYVYPPPVDRTDVLLTSPSYNPTALYRDYVRFYLPLTATLSRIGYLEDGQPAPAFGGGLQEQGVANDRQVVGTFFILHRGHTADLILDYQVGLPADPPFQLYVQKQPGIPSLPFELEVSYPGGIADRKAVLTQDATFTIPW